MLKRHVYGVVLVYLDTDDSVLILTMSPLIFPIGGVRISFERCNICKHKHGARVMAFVILVSRHLLMVYESFL